MSLTVALEFASRGYAVLPATANKKPLTRHGVYSATTNPDVLALYNWHSAYCAVATGKVSGIDVLDIDVRARPIHRPNSGALGQSGRVPNEGQGVCLSDAEGVNGFETLEALGGILPDTLAASSPSGGRHYWFKHIEGCRSKDLGPGLQWFSDKKFVLTPPAPDREWLNTLSIAEAPDWLVKLVLAEPLTHTWQHTHSSVPPLANGPSLPLTASQLLDLRSEGVTKPEPRPKPVVLPSQASVPKAIYLQILRLMRTASNHDQRRVIRTLAVLLAKKQGRNDALHWASRSSFRELIASGAIKPAGACMLLVEASKANGYLAKDGEEAVRLTIMSGLGLKEWPEEVAKHNPFTAQERRV